MNNAEHLEEIFGKAVEHGYMPQEVKDMQIKVVKPYYENIPASAIREVN